MSGELKIGTLVQCLGGTPNLEHRKFAGTVHTVAEQVARGPRGEPAYHLDPPTCADCGLPLTWSKKYLRIIDNPSDDAVDEALAWKPVPNEVTT